MTLERHHCRVCHQWVEKDQWGFGPWCDLYFRERRVACLPRTLAAIAWLRREHRHTDADVLAEYVRRKWNTDGVTIP